MTSVTLHTQPYSAPLSILNMKKVTITAQEVIALQVQRQPIVDFRHSRQLSGSENKYEIQLPQIMTGRLQHFCRMYYVISNGNFDCRTFLLHMMGWKGGEITKNRIKHQFVGIPQSPDTSVVGKPYLIPSPSEEEPPHLMLGILRAGYSLGVMGVNGPLLIAKNADLIKIYGSREIAEIKTAQPIK